MTKRKFKQGQALSLGDAVSAIASGGYIYYRHKVYHHGWASSWALRTIIVAANKGWLREAVRQ